jgi:M6 family metalloprotease-like protein
MPHFALACLALALAQDPDDTPFRIEVLPKAVRAAEDLASPVRKAEGKVRERAELGARFGAPRSGGLEVQSIVPRGPAADEGVLPGDVVKSIGRTQVRDAEDLEVALGLLEVGKSVPLVIKRPGIRREVAIELRDGEALGNPGFEARRTKGAFEVTDVRPGSPAARGGLKLGDTFARIDNVHLSSSSALRKLMEKKTKFVVHVQRAESNLTPKVRPVGAPPDELLDWNGKSFRLAVVLLEFADVKHDARFASKDFARMLFAPGDYTQAPDGRPTYGSMRDYYKEVSCGRFDVDGVVFDWVQVPNKWAYYDAQDMGGGDGSASTVFDDSLRALKAKHGADALAKFDGVVFLYAGERKSLRGSQLWPHRASVPIGGRFLPYYITEEGGAVFNSIGVHCHEFGHMLGLPDFYGYGHRTGVGKFCTMAIGHQGAGESKADRPFHLCAYCKIKLGWLTPKVVLPNEHKTIALRGVVGRTTEAIKIPISPSWDEYYLLEVRNKNGFDADFFRDGLLIWHVGEDGQREKGQIGVAIDLEEAHGKRYFDASLREEARVPFPYGESNAFTPATEPSSKSNLDGAHDLFLTDIAVYRPQGEGGDPRFPTGTVVFTVGDKEAARKVASAAIEQPTYPRTPVTELDPVTNLPVPFTIGDDNVALPGPNIMPREKAGEEAGKKKGGR